MAVLWFVHPVQMYGFPAYQSAASELLRKLGGAASCKFVGRLDQVPTPARPHHHDHIASYDRCCSNWLIAKHGPGDGDRASTKSAMAARRVLSFWASRTFPQTMGCLNGKGGAYRWRSCGSPMGAGRIGA
jgi:hypothetical protein